MRGSGRRPADAKLASSLWTSFAELTATPWSTVDTAVESRCCSWNGSAVTLATEDALNTVPSPTAISACVAPCTAVSHRSCDVERPLATVIGLSTRLPFGSERKRRSSRVPLFRLFRSQTYSDPPSAPATARVPGGTVQPAPHEAGALLLPALVPSSWTDPEVEVAYSREAYTIALGVPNAPPNTFCAAALGIAVSCDTFCQ